MKVLFIFLLTILSFNAFSEATTGENKKGECIYGQSGNRVAGKDVKDDVKKEVKTETKTLAQ